MQHTGKFIHRNEELTRRKCVVQSNDSCICLLLQLLCRLLCNEPTLNHHQRPPLAAIYMDSIRNCKGVEHSSPYEICICKQFTHFRFFTFRKDLQRAPVTNRSYAKQISR